MARHSSRGDLLRCDADSRPAASTPDLACCMPACSSKCIHHFIDTRMVPPGCADSVSQQHPAPDLQCSAPDLACCLQCEPVQHQAATPSSGAQAGFSSPADRLVMVVPL